MNDQTILLVGAFCFSMMVIGLALTAVEFRRNLSKKRAKRASLHAANDD